MSDEKVLIYATGSDVDLRKASFELLRAELATAVDRIDKQSIAVVDGKDRVGGGVAFMIVSQRGRVPAVFERLRSIPGTRAQAVPIVDAL